ncbi:Mrp family chromosome partitioning ATPase [Sphingomonas jinjuensis]|uniref:Mrp family chromosome partitioning ATPase n=1 Tax=Sphingomonas jinjuensis TaxID=535907 RepID=A0A840FB76_9SPHN|nr:CpsD/CapB family tyrosine-protein kinase [Sphingomonas jinjuensis]MBB4152777.1 Mrp family chromosome partitioning ATPase [Sphingomonas jinjuensis]
MADMDAASLAAQMLRAKTEAAPVTREHMDPALVGFMGRDQRSRAFNLLRTQIVRMLGDGRRIIGLTSPTPQVGKTFVISNLSASLSRIPEMQTFLFDFDLRRGSVAQRFGIPPSVGLADYLSGDVDTIDGMARRMEDEKLIIYPTFEKEMYSSELMASARFSSLIAGMRAVREPSIFMCDLPPVFANDDAMIACEQLDGYLLVVEDGVTTSKQLKDSMRLLGPEKCLGTVLNRYIQGFGGDYGFGYGSQGSYAEYYS